MESSELELSKELCDAIAGDRESAFAMWRELAKDPHGLEAMIWAKHVAQRILGIGKIDRRRRGDALLKALGLVGRADRYRALGELLEVFDAFEDLDAPKWLTPGQEARRYYKALRTHAAATGIPARRLPKVVARIKNKRR